MFTNALKPIDKATFVLLPKKIISAVTLSRPVVHLFKLFLQLEVMTRTAEKRFKKRTHNIDNCQTANSYELQKKRQCELI